MKISRDNKRRLRITVIVLLFVLVGSLSSCAKDDYMEIGCECEWVKYESYMSMSNGVPISKTRKSFTSSIITDCSLDGLSTDKGILNCKDN